MTAASTPSTSTIVSVTAPSVVSSDRLCEKDREISYSARTCRDVWRSDSSTEPSASPSSFERSWRRAFCTATASWEARAASRVTSVAASVRRPGYTTSRPIDSSRTCSGTASADGWPAAASARRARTKRAERSAEQLRRDILVPLGRAAAGGLAEPAVLEQVDGNLLDVQELGD